MALRQVNLYQCTNNTSCALSPSLSAKVFMALATHVPHPPAPVAISSPQPCHLSYVIFTMQRSASTSLCAVLSGHGHACLGELFNIAGDLQSRALESLSNTGSRFAKQLNLSRARIIKQPFGFVNRVLRSSNATLQRVVKTRMSVRRVAHDDAWTHSHHRCQAGFKLMPAHPLAPRTGALLASTCVLLRRENVTAQYISWRRAITQGCWATTPKLRRNCSARPVHVEPTSLARFAQRGERWWAEVQAACAAARRPLVLLSMERFVSGEYDLKALADAWMTFSARTQGVQ